MNLNSEPTKEVKEEKEPKIVYAKQLKVGQGKLRITKNLYDRIQYLHRNYPNQEWSAILLYKVISGSLRDPDNLVLEANELFLMDLGSSAYTEYTVGIEILDMYDNIPDVDSYRIGHIHSHHSMTTFFSKTDTEELEDNAHLHIWYLSLIVNNAGTYSAKAAMYVKESVEGITRYDFKDVDETAVVINDSDAKERPVLGIVDFDIEMVDVTDSVDDFFKQRFTTLKDKKNAKSKAPILSNVSNYRDRGYTGGYGQPYNSFNKNNFDRGEHTALRHNGVTGDVKQSNSLIVRKKPTPKLNKLRNKLPFSILASDQSINKFVALLLTADCEEPFEQISVAKRMIESKLRAGSTEEAYLSLTKVSDFWLPLFVNECMAKALNFANLSKKSAKSNLPQDIINEAYELLINDLIIKSVDYIDELDILPIEVKDDYSMVLTEMVALDPTF